MLTGNSVSVFIYTRGQWCLIIVFGLFLGDSRTSSILLFLDSLIKLLIKSCKLCMVIND